MVYFREDHEIGLGKIKEKNNDEVYDFGKRY